MRLFIRKLTIFLLFFLITVLLFYGVSYIVIGNQYNQNYQASLIDKVERLESINEPKIILVGNSNVCFGMDSEMIEKEFGMPVVDLGLHGGLGNSFLENIAKLNIRKGDIVIVCHSNYNDDGTLPDPDLACITMEWNTKLWNILQAEDIPNILKASPKYIFHSVLLWISGKGNQPSEDSCYTRGAFNQYGDIEYRPDSSFVFQQGTINVPEISEACVKRLNEFHQYVSKREAVLLIAGYPIGDGEYTPDRAEYRKFQEELEERLDAEIISNYTDYFYPYDCFYNTNLHMTEEGARKRTQQLIEDLQVYFDSIKKNF